MPPTSAPGSASSERTKSRWYADPYDAGFAPPAELQGGLYALPVVGPPDVRPEATDPLLARTVGHGLKSGRSR